MLEKELRGGRWNKSTMIRRLPDHQRSMTGGCSRRKEVLSANGYPNMAAMWRIRSMYV